MDSEREGDSRLERTGVLRGVLLQLNEQIRSGASKLDAADPGVSWDFRCECGAPDCEAMVEVTLGEFDAMRAREEPVLAAGHSVSEATLTRRKSQRLKDDASALGAQASQQIRHARDAVRGRVLVVDDNEAMRTTAAAVVTTAKELRLVGTAASGEEAIQLLHELQPDFILLDIRMPGIDGIETAHIVGDQNPNIVVVLYSADPTALDRATRTVEAAAYLDKTDIRPHTLDELWHEHRSVD